MNLKKIVSFLLVIILLGFLFWNVINNLDTIKSFPWKFNFIQIILLLIFLIPIYMANVFSWYLVTKSQGLNISFKKNLRIWMLSNLSRYLPGGIWQYPTRVYLLSKEGSSKIKATSAVLIEVLFNISVGSLIILIYIIFGRFSLGLNGLERLLILIISIPVLLVFISNNKILISISKYLRKFNNKFESIKGIKLSFKWLLPLTGAFFIQFFLAGTVLFILSTLAIDLSLGLIPTFIVIFTASWLLGYITFFAPSGLGVQEVSIAGFLTFFMPFPIASAVAILFRITLLISEVIFIYLVLFVLKNKT